MKFDALRILSLLAFDSVAKFSMPTDVLMYPLVAAAIEETGKEFYEERSNDAPGIRERKRLGALTPRTEG